MKRHLVFVLSAFTIAAMGGCELKCRSEPEGSAEKIGEAIDKAVEDVKDSSSPNTEVKIKVKETPKKP